MANQVRPCAFDHESWFECLWLVHLSRQSATHLSLEQCTFPKDIELHLTCSWTGVTGSVLSGLVMRAARLLPVWLGEADACMLTRGLSSRLIRFDREIRAYGVKLQSKSGIAVHIDCRAKRRSYIGSRRACWVPQRVLLYRLTKIMFSIYHFFANFFAPALPLRRCR